MDKIWPKRAKQKNTELHIRTCSLELRPQPQSTGMEVDVVAHEGGDEVVGVVVEGLHPQLHVVVVLGGRQKEVLWLQLGLQEAVSCALVDQDGHLREESYGSHGVKPTLGPE